MTRVRLKEIRERLDRLAEDQERSEKEIERLRENNADAIRRADEARQLLERA
jgi:hypothetical protein